MGGLKNSYRERVQTEDAMDLIREEARRFGRVKTEAVYSRCRIKGCSNESVSIALRNLTNNGTIEYLPRSGEYVLRR